MVAGLTTVCCDDWAHKSVSFVVAAFKSVFLLSWLGSKQALFCGGNSLPVVVTGICRGSWAHYSLLVLVASLITVSLM